jgi:hypothetical protein
MATVAGIKIANKVKKTRNPIFFDEKYTGPEPAWDTERARDMTDEDFDHHLRRSFYYYNYYYNQKETKKYVVEWMKSVADFSKEEVRAFERAADRSIPMTVCSLVMAHRAGMPFRPRHIEFMTKMILTAIGTAEPEAAPVAVAAKTEVYRPTIQDRLNEKTSELIGELEGRYDDVFGNVKTDFKPYDFFTANSVAQSQLGKYQAVFQRHRDELARAQAKADEQLVEGYRFLKTADYRRILSWLDALLAAIEQYRDVKRATKRVTRVKKAPAKDKLVARLKYAKENKELKLVSISPVDIVGATELWIFNAKTRKLGRYVAASYQTLTVKGTSILNFDDQKSVAKTLRKPADQLKEFAKAGKVALRTFIKDIRATEIRLNGRINEDTVLLKVQ